MPFNQSVQNQWYNNLYGPGNCVDQIIDCNTHGINEVCDAADNFCYYETEYIYDLNSGRDEYDFRELTPDPFPPEFYVDYLNTPKVQAAIGAYQNYTESSSTVGAAFATTGDDNRVLKTVVDMLKLIEVSFDILLSHVMLKPFSSFHKNMSPIQPPMSGTCQSNILELVVSSTCVPPADWENRRISQSSCTLATLTTSVTG